MPKKPNKPAAKRKAVQPITVVSDHAARDKVRMEKAASQLNLNNLSLEERSFLGTCQEIYRNDIGCYTPFESFFTELVRWTAWGNPPTLETLRAYLADPEGEFVNNWIGLERGVKRFLENYPDFISEFQEAPSAKDRREPLVETANA